MSATNENQMLLMPSASASIIESLYPPVEPQLAYEVNEILVDDSCPDCDSLLEQFYDGNGNPKFFCDNCGSLVHGSNAVPMSDMDISQESDC